MTVQIEVREETAVRLQTIARALKLPLDEYLARVADLVVVPHAPAPAPPTEAPDPQGQALLAVLARSTERLKDLPVSGETKDTLEMIRRARNGEMWGDDPAK